MTRQPNQYARVAVRAATLLAADQRREPRSVWESVAREECKKTSCADKVCPRSAFLGLCEDGLVKGVRPGAYLKGIEQDKINKRHALIGIKLLCQGTIQAPSPMELWRRVLAHEGSVFSGQHQGAMDVVLALWQGGLVIQP